MPVFTVLGDVEHVLQRPSVYTGFDYGASEVETLVADGGTVAFARVCVDRIALKAFDEVLVNACDCIERGSKRGAIDVAIAESGFRISNDGSDIPTTYDAGLGVFVPHALFGILRSSCNYDDSVERTGGGVNGIGCKLANIMCSRMVVEVTDEDTHYEQAFSNNMRVAESPVVVPRGEKAPHMVRVTAVLDPARCSWADATRSVCARRVYDVAACYAGVRVTLDGVHLTNSPHAPYAEMYTGEVVRLEVPGYVVYVAEARTRGVMVSFVNGVSTPDHGAHVTHVSRRLHEAVASSLGDEPPWRRFVAERLFIMLLARLDRPSFRGNEKSSVCLPLRPEPGKFGRAALRGSRVPLLWREWGESSASSSLQRDERRRRKLTVEKLDDAAQAGSREWQRCTLILTEGDSAKSFALAGLAVVGRVYYGVFPLRGKVKNVRDSTATQADGNKELRSLKTILGLSSGSGLDAHALRYGRVLIMTDQDVDGFHIKGLVLNFLDSQFPGLIGARLFVECMRTPLIKAVVRGTTHEFFSVSSYDAFARERAAPCASVKYYKGLGTSTAAEARAYFSDLRRYVVRYTPVGMERLTQLFAKGTIAERKSSVRAALCAVARDEAVEQRDDDGFVVQSIGSLVDTELMEYSVDAVHRCIPSVVDGLKPSQRKILWSMLRGASGEKKVAQLASYVAHDTAYHHGEASLQQAIIGMAQDFTGSNNCELLQPIGQFGTRRAGGDDAASPRYIFTRLACVATAVFVADDLALVPPRHDEGQSIEPPFLLPVIPWLLVNGASGIGTAFSTVVPPHDVRCVCAATRAWVLAHQREGASSAPAPELTMSVRGFTGPVLLEAGRSRYRTTTVVRLERPGVVAVTDLPVGMWTDAYKDLLDGLLERKRIGRYVNESTDTRVLFRVEGVVDVADLEAERFVSVRNMHALDETHGLRLWASVGEIVDYFCVLRLPYYEMRLARSIADAESALTRISGIRDLIDLVISGGAGVLFSCEDTDALFETLRFVRVGGSYDHLLRVSVRCCTLARRDHMARELITTEAALVALRGTSAYALWLTDISNVERVVAA